MSMIESLRRIVQEVNAVKDVDAALELIVLRVSTVMQTEVCSVYLLDQDKKRLFFKATEGLNKSLIGTASLALGQGLVGKVALREETVSVENVYDDPNFKLVEGIGEEGFYSFLAVPIIHQRVVLGVLVVQQSEPRRFDEAEEAFLVTLSAQLAAVISHASATGGMKEKTALAAAVFKGIGGAEAVGIGVGVVVAEKPDLAAVPDRICKDIEKEVAFFQKCLIAVRDDMKRMGDVMGEQLPKEEAALFDAYIGMLDDTAFSQEVIDRIRGGSWAQGALAEVMLSHIHTFEMMDDEYLRERAVDIRDLGERVLAYLQADVQSAKEYPDNTILVGKELTASMLAEVPKSKLVGLVSVRGSANSHVAIMARALGIPTVVGAVDLPFTRLEGKDVIIDGGQGNIFCNPSVELIEQYRRVIQEHVAISKDLEQLNDLPCETLDGYRLPVWVNTGLVSEVAPSLEKGAEGVGLYRTEIPFLLRDRFPTEEEQRHLYRQQMQAFYPLPVTMRTLDIGGDKALPYFPIVEDNPFLGWRGIRVTLDHPEIFLAQVRAMMKASVGLDNLRVMLPMVSGVSELEEALELFYRAHDELVEEGWELPIPPVGVMVEVPSAIYLAGEFAKRVDFLSVGSNDLAQYLLAVDRNNPQVADLYHSLHPAILRALKQAIDYAGSYNKPVSICGEMAGDPGAAILLLAMGFSSLSMSSNNLPRVKAAIRQISMSDAKALLNDVLSMDNEKEIQMAVNNALDKLSLSYRNTSPNAIH